MYTSDWNREGGGGEGAQKACIWLALTDAARQFLQSSRTSLRLHHQQYVRIVFPYL